MKRIYFILPFFLILLAIPGKAAGEPETVSFDFFGEQISFAYDRSQFIDYNEAISVGTVESFYKKLDASRPLTILDALADYREIKSPDDWLFYQLVRKTAEQISPKSNNYLRYTLYKWYFLLQSGYDAILLIAGDQLLFYVQSDENIYNIPSRVRDGKQYVCLNYHDYGYVDFEKDLLTEVSIPTNNKTRSFSYKVTRLPSFNEDAYVEKRIDFNYYKSQYHFTVMLNSEVKLLFNNYPVVDYSSYLNIPLSATTYSSLIPELKKNIQGMKTREGVDYLMRFTRYAFGFEKDNDQFGNEKRLSPEQTLMYDQSDCEDRVALFYFLVREIYNLPMIVITYPDHVSIAVKFDKPVGKSIEYNGEKYSICEPTPQSEDLFIGQTAPGLEKTPYQIVYAYKP